MRADISAVAVAAAAGGPPEWPSRAQVTVHAATHIYKASVDTAGLSGQIEHSRHGSAWNRRLLYGSNTSI